MKIYIKKDEALRIIPLRNWIVTGTLVKTDKNVAPGKVLEAVKDLGYRMKRFDSRIVVSRRDTPNKYYLSEDV